MYNTLVNSLIQETRLPSGTVYQLVQGDILEEESQSIVNAANRYLQHMGGLAWAIVQKGGTIIQSESNDWVLKNGPVSHSSPAWTSGGNLSVKYIIHAVGPSWGEGNEEAKLADAINGSLLTAEILGITSISLPAISTGIFGFPKDLAAGITMRTISGYFSTGRTTSIQLVRVVLFDNSTLIAFSKAWNDHFTTKPKN